MALLIDQDARRFRQIVRGKVKQNLRKYMSNREMIGARGKDYVSIPIPQIDLPHFRFGDPRGGVGQGAGDVGTPLGPGPQGKGMGNAGNQSGSHILEVEVSLEELAQILGQELELPRIQPKSKNNVQGDTSRYTSLRRVGPNSLRHFKRTYREVLKRQLSSGAYAWDRPNIVPIREDMRYRSWKTYPRPDSNAVIIYMMDISGSMTQQKKELVRTTAFWIDTWLQAHYKNLTTRYIVHDANAAEVDAATFYHIRENGGTRISAAYELCKEIIQRDYGDDMANLYGFHFSDGENFDTEDDARCLNLLRMALLPSMNLFGYGQVANGYGALFLGTLGKLQDEKLVMTEIQDQDSIYDAIKALLGKGV